MGKKVTMQHIYRKQIYSMKVFKINQLNSISLEKLNFDTFNNFKHYIYNYKNGIIIYI